MTNVQQDSLNFSFQCIPLKKSLRKTANLQDSGCSLGGNAKSTRRGKKWDKVWASVTIFLPKWAQKPCWAGSRVKSRLHNCFGEKLRSYDTPLKIWLWGDLFYDIYWLKIEWLWLWQKVYQPTKEIWSMNLPRQQYGLSPATKKWLSGALAIAVCPHQATLDFL